MKSAWLDQLAAMQAPLPFFVANRFKIKDGSIACTKWFEWKDWKQQRKNLPNYRQVLHNEIVLETYFPRKQENWETAQAIMKILREKNCAYRCWFSGNKSFHIHLLFTNMEVVE
jgi:hypothetical protein